MFWRRKFHEYIYSNDIIIQTHDKPATSVHSEQTNLLSIHLLSSRMQRMRMLKGHMYFADTLSRAYTTKIEANDFHDDDISVPTDTTHQNDHRNGHKEIKGWPKTNKDILAEIKSFLTYRQDITTFDNILLKGNK